MFQMKCKIKSSQIYNLEITTRGPIASTSIPIIARWSATPIMGLKIKPSKKSREICIRRVSIRSKDGVLKINMNYHPEIDNILEHLQQYK